MNWNKALNVLVMLFIILNLVLLGLQYDKNKDEYTLSEARKKQMNALATENGISIYSYIPDNYSPKGVMELREADIASDQIIDSVFGEAEYETKMSYNGVVAQAYLNDQQTLVFYTGEDKGKVYYTGKNPRYGLASNSLDDYKKTAKLFVADFLNTSAEFEITNYRETETGYLFELNEVYKGQYIFNNYVRLNMDQEGVREALGSRYTPTQLTSVSAEIYPIDEVVYKLIFYLDKSGKENITIDDIELGYYIFDPMGQKILYSGDPTYRFMLKDGDVYYVNAYTNEIFE